MMKRMVKLSVLSVAVLAFAPLLSVAAEPAPAPQKQAEEKVFGMQLMTQEERREHRAKMQSFKTMEERQAYRQEHHKKMLERAKAKGVKLPDEPMGPGMGGMGPRGN